MHRIRFNVHSQPLVAYRGSIFALPFFVISFHAYSRQLIFNESGTSFTHAIREWIALVAI